MSITIGDFTITDPLKVTIDSEPNRSYGRRFEVKIKGTDAATITTMNELYKSAKAALKTAQSQVEFENLEVFVTLIENAEIQGQVQYLDAGCMYDFRTFFHRLFGGSFFGTHTKRIEKLQGKIHEKIIKNPWAEASKYTEKAYEALPTPKEFTDVELTNDQFENFLHIHKGILNGESANHGNADTNLIRAFKNGNGYTTQGGEGPFFTDSKLNTAFHTKVKVTLTLISKMEMKEQQLCMRKLQQAFVACNTGRIEAVVEMHAQLLGDSTALLLGDRIRLKTYEHKKALFDQMIRQEHKKVLKEWMRQFPMQPTPIHLQIPHLTSGYLAELGKDLGLNGFNEAAQDPHKNRINGIEKNAFISNFKTAFNSHMAELSEDIAREINDPNGSFNVREGGFGVWHCEKVQNNEIHPSFAMYASYKKDQYKNLIPATEDQKDIDNGIYYISTSEVKQILGMLDYLEEPPISTLRWS